MNITALFKFINSMSIVIGVIGSLIYEEWQRDLSRPGLRVNHCDID